MQNVVDNLLSSPKAYKTAVQAWSIYLQESGWDLQLVALADRNMDFQLVSAGVGKMHGFPTFVFFRDLSSTTSVHCAIRHRSID